jgi:hypothetical protein
MRHFEKIVLHPKLENDSRQEVRDWLQSRIPDSQDWRINSNYDEHGCFNITILGNRNMSVATAFMLVYPDTLIVETQFHDTYEIAPEAALLFDFGD